MAITHHVQIRVSTTGLIGGGGGADIDIMLTSADYDHSQLTLASGNNTIAIASGGLAILFIPPTANTQTIILKGNTGDTGIPLSKTEPSYVSLDASGDDVILTAGAEITGCEVYLL